MKLNVNGKSVEVKVQRVYSRGVSFEINGKNYFVEKELSGSEYTSQAPPTQSTSRTTKKSDGNTISAPISGLITKILIKKGDTVTQGQELLILEAMKMQNKIYATRDAVIAEITVTEGVEVSEGDGLVTLGEG